LLTVPLAVLGSQLGHAIAYAIATSHDAGHAHGEPAGTHAYMAYAPLALAIGVVLVIIALGSELRGLLRGPRGESLPPSPWTFAVLAPAIFVTQEHLERLVDESVIPWSAAFEPTFAIGLLVQLPIALGAYLLARALLRAVRTLIELLTTFGQRRQIAEPCARPAALLFVPCVPVLGLGYGSRGPPQKLVV
jgi:hypothetical protein